MKKMRRVLLLFVTGIMFVLAGCNHMPIHFGQIENYPTSNDYEPVDDPAPEEALCTLVIDDTLTLVRIGEAGEMWANGSYGASGDCFLKITAGKRTLGFDYYYSSSRDGGNWTITTTSSAKGISITYEFEPGRTYRVFPDFSTEGQRVSVGIKETSFPVRFGWRMGPYLGWQQGSTSVPFAGLFALAQAGVVVPAGNTAMEFLAEANAGVGYSPFEKESSIYNEEYGNEFVTSIGFNLQFGGTANFYFGKSERKTGFGLGGGAGLGNDGNDIVYIPYVRVSFLPSGDFWYTRLFVDYSFTQEDIWKRLGVGAVFFVK